jgi:hypothetical protein
MVIQATPPFLVVHTNAAYTRLTGVDSHHVVGQAISSILSLPEGYRPQDTHHNESEDGSNPQASDSSTNEPNQSSHANLALERLIATSGHGKVQLLRIASKPHHMVGRSVTITRETYEGSQNDTQLHKKEDQAVHDDASSSRNEKLQQKPCRAAIAPIVSVSAYMPRASMSLEKEADLSKQKRRKSHSTENGEMSALTPVLPSNDHRSRPSSPSKDHKKNANKLVVTHYLIQLEDIGANSGKNLSMESLSSNSTSVEARIVGLSKDQYKKQKIAAAGVQEATQDSQDPADDEGGNSESTVPEHVTTLG